jgi:hypothetical protein
VRRGIEIALLFLAAPALAEESSFGAEVQKKLEMPGHRSLMSEVTDPKASLSEFETDGCSGGMSWSWRVVADLFPDFKDVQGAQPPWEACCVTHDQAYHNAGGATEAEASFAARLAADEALRQCVASPSQEEIDAVVARYEVAPEQVEMAYELIATSMFNAVRFGGGPCSGLPWRWGFGYPGCVPGF